MKIEFSNLIRFKNVALIAGGIASLIASHGCNKPTSITASFEPNYVYSRAQSEKAQLVSEDIDPMEEPLAKIQVLMVDWFGTPDKPKLPSAEVNEEIGELVKLERLEMAAGPAPMGKEPGNSGLFRQQCVTCHGETGSGRGPTAASQNPYPRDFRHGVFKFKSTSRNKKPVRDDLKRTIQNGLAGTQMQAFNKLSDEQIESLVDYVIYLSIRGETERALIGLTAKAFGEASSVEEAELPELSASNEDVTAILSRITKRWAGAEESVEDFQPEDGIPVPGMTDPVDPESLKESIARGKSLFLGTVANCVKCHGESGKADGKQTPDYDDWIKDWTAKSEIQLDETEKIEKLMSLGAMKPQVILPRNLTEGKFRGGNRPIDLFRRIRYGIEGTPMPEAAIAASEGAPGLQEKDIWDIVNFVLSLSAPENVSSTAAL